MNVVYAKAMVYRVLAAMVNLIAVLLLMHAVCAEVQAPMKTIAVPMMALAPTIWVQTAQMSVVAQRL